MATKKSNAKKSPGKKSRTTKSRSVRAMMSAMPTASPSGVFFDIPLDLNIVEDQIRSMIDQAGEAFLALVASIREKGVLEPIIVTPQGEHYRLISGERRLLACRMLGLATIPARVVDAVTAKDEILAMQLTENLLRADLDPIDTARAVVGFFQLRHPEEGFDLDGIINAMILVEREPDRVKNEIVVTVTTILNISGKSPSSLKRACSLLRLPEEIQNALREGTLGVSQGYLFAANLAHPKLMEILREAIGAGFTNAGLEEALKKGWRPVKKGGTRKRPFSQFTRSVQSVRTGIEEQVDAFRKSDLETLLNDLRELVALVEGRLPEAIDEGGAARSRMKQPRKKGKKK